jgi:hypothetical protein
MPSSGLAAFTRPADEKKNPALSNKPKCRVSWGSVVMPETTPTHVLSIAPAEVFPQLTQK